MLQAPARRRLNRLIDEGGEPDIRRNTGLAGKTIAALAAGTGSYQRSIAAVVSYLRVMRNNPLPEVAPVLSVVAPRLDGLARAESQTLQALNIKLQLCTADLIKLLEGASNARLTVSEYVQFIVAQHVAKP